MCAHMSPGTEGVVDAKLVPVLVAKLLKEEDEIKVCTCLCITTCSKLPVYTDSHLSRKFEQYC